MGFFEELKRRNVVRVGIAYVVASWLLLQLTEVLTELLEIGPDVGKIVIVLLIIGFIPALIFAWAFEMTPEGIKREQDVDRSQSITSSTGRKLDFVIIGALVIALAYFIVDKVNYRSAVPAGNEDPGLANPAGDASIAVLPFVNMSNDPEQEFFSDGISEELLNLLVRVDGLKVASRTSSFTYKGANRNIPEIARELKVGHILEGSVRKANNRVRITAQLIETNSDRHLWSDTFDRELDDIFAIQDEISNAIVDALKDELGIGLESVKVEAATANLDAYDLYLKARNLFTARENLGTAARLYEQAIELDPNYALAWEGLSAVHSVSASWLSNDGIDHNSLANQAAKKALEIDPELSMPYAVLAMSDSRGPESTLSRMHNLELAIEKDPKNTSAWLWKGLSLKNLGMLDQAAVSIRKCLEIDSGYLNCKQHLAEALFFAGKTDEAIRLFEETIVENFHSVSETFVPHYLRIGERITALLLATTGTDRLAPYAPVKYWIDAIENPDKDQSANTARFMQWADEAGVNCADMGPIIVAFGLYDCIDLTLSARPIWHPDAADFRKTDKFKAMADRYFMPYWKKHGFPPQCRQLEGVGFECD